jgi:hypothetical protein
MANAPDAKEIDKLPASDGRLGLTPDVPDAFLPHIKRAILLSLHPDRHPDSRKAAAQKRFVEAMAVFDSIKDDRQLADV